MTSPFPVEAERMDLPEEIVRAIRVLIETCLFANRFNDAALINRNTRSAVEALTTAILSRLSAAEAGREEAAKERDLLLYRVCEIHTAGVRALRDAESRVNAVLDDACRMNAILLMAGEMSPQERLTAQAVANGLAAKVRAALTEAQPKGDQ